MGFCTCRQNWSFSTLADRSERKQGTNQCVSLPRGLLPSMAEASLSSFPPYYVNSRQGSFITSTCTPVKILLFYPL